MRVIRGRQVVEDDWRFIDDGDVIAEGDAIAEGEVIAEGDAIAEGDVIVSFRRWRDEPEALTDSRGGKLGVWVDGDDDIRDVVEYLGRFDLIAVKFPVFTDGRSFTVARQLREYYGYRGELRAVGDVARDQLWFMARCGIDSFALREGADFDAALEAFDELSLAYQPAADAAVLVNRSRHGDRSDNAIGHPSSVPR